jgi:hypothetical protein
MNVSEGPGEVDLRPLSARSVVLSLLLGTHPPELPVRDLLRAVEPLGVAASTLRAALSRMVAAGDLRSADAVYLLSDRLLDRQRRQDIAVHPETRPWDGDWEMTVVTATGRGPAERAELRGELTALRLAELREGVWLRPANLLRPRPDELGAVARHFTTRPEESPPPPTVRPNVSPYWPPPYGTCSPTRSCPPNSCPPTGRALPSAPHTRTTGGSWSRPCWGNPHSRSGRAKRRAGTLRTAAVTGSGSLVRDVR